MFGFLMMFVAFCIVAGQCGLDKGKTLRGRDEARKKGKDWYLDGHSIMRSSTTGKQVDLRCRAGANFLYEWNSCKIIRDYKAEKIHEWNQELEDKKSKGRYHVVWFDTIWEEGSDYSFAPLQTGNIIVRKELETGKPYILEHERQYNKKTKQFDNILCLYYFVNNKVQVGSHYYKKYKNTIYYLCNVDKNTRKELSKEEAPLYDLNKIDYFYKKYDICSEKELFNPPFFAHKIYFIK